MVLYSHYDRFPLAQVEFESCETNSDSMRSKVRSDLKKPPYTFHRRALGRGIRGNLYVVPDQVFENPREWVDIMFTVQKEDNPKEHRQARVSKDIWVDSSVYISLRIGQR